jgi:multidrug resistance efflux pump
MEDNNTLQAENETEILYNTRSEEAQEVIGRMPHWIIRWGITVMAGFVLLLFVIAAFVKYPETISTQIQLAPLHSPTIVSSIASGNVKQIFIADSQQVNKGQPLLQTTSDSSGEDFSVTAPVDGRAVFVMDVKQGMSIQKKEPLIAIILPSFNSNDVIVTGIVDASNKKRLSVGQTIDVQLANYPQETYGRLKGKIYKISPVAIGGDYIFNVRFENGLMTTNHNKINVQDKLVGTGNIIVKDKTILARLFEKLKMF